MIDAFYQFWVAPGSKCTITVSVTVVVSLRFKEVSGVMGSGAAPF